MINLKYMNTHFLKLFRTLAFIAGTYIMSNTKNSIIFYAIYIPLAIYFSYLGFLAVKLLVKMRLYDNNEWREKDTHKFSWKYLLFVLAILFFLALLIVSISWYGVIHKVWLFPQFAA